jgi:hypothetical protein
MAKTGVVAALVCCSAASVLIVAITPMVLASAYDPQDSAHLASIGESYDIIAAVVSATVLTVVSFSLVVQFLHYRHSVRSTQRDRIRETVRMAMEHPQYAQCWGSRFAPEHIEEELFFYTNFVVLNWRYAWEDRLLDEPQARAYMRRFFDSTVPRMFWERHGDWHQPRRAMTRRSRFAAMMNEEYLRALKAGPPTREYESSVPRAHQLGTHDQTSPL